MSMSSGHEEEPRVAYRCKACGHIETAQAQGGGRPCARCGSADLVEAPVEGASIRYSIADRRGGPSIEDGRLGRMACFAGWMTPEQVTACLERQWEVIRQGRPAPRFGEVAVEAGILSSEQVNALLRVQAIHRPSPGDQAFGALAVRRGYITREELDACLAEQAQWLQLHREAPLLGNLLVEKKLLNVDQVREILQAQAQQGVGPLAQLTQPAREEQPTAVEAAPAVEPDRPPTLDEKATPPCLPAGRPADTVQGKILCRCEACGHTTPLPSWKASLPCPQCGSKLFAPLPVIGEPTAYSVGDRRAGPTIEDNRLGRMAYYAGWMTMPQVQHCLRIQNKAISEGRPPPRFGEAAIGEGYLEPSQVNALLRIQAIHRPVRHDQTFGAIAVRKGFVSQQQLDECLVEQKRVLEQSREAPLLGIIMQEKGLLTEIEVKAILGLQARYRLGPLPELEEAVKPEPTRLESALQRLGSLRSWPVYVSAPVLLFSLLMILTSWFGTFAWEPDKVIVGCKKCRAALVVPADQTTTCPQCGAERALAPLARCKKCSHVFLFGALYAGTRCPKCGSKEHASVESVSAAVKEWKMPAREAPPKPATPANP